MAISIQTKGGGFSGAASTNVSLSGLTLSEGDLVIIATSIAKNGNRGMDISSNGWTSLFNLYQNYGANDMSMSAGYKLMTSTPDSTVTVTIASYTGTYVQYAIYVLSGVDNDNPLDVTTTTATGVESNVPNPPSISPVTNGALVLAVGSSFSGSPNDVDAPSGYSNLIRGIYDNVPMCIASKLWSGSGAEDPGNFNWTTTDTSWSWCAATLAIRPSANDINSKFFQLF